MKQIYDEDCPRNNKSIKMFFFFDVKKNILNDLLLQSYYKQVAGFK